MQSNNNNKKKLTRKDFVPTIREKGQIRTQIVTIKTGRRSESPPRPT